jgi:predicted ATP-grasp superfamily ATP-dependent carboligase
MQIRCCSYLQRETCVFLSVKQLRALTGRVHKDKILEWLKANRWRHVVDSDGMPKVAEEYYRKKMIAANDESFVQSSSEPNFAALVKKRIANG